MPRSHDRTHFYKFATFDTACKILETCKLRWSSPLLFNDPFDHQLEIIFGFDKQEFQHTFLNELERLIFEPDDIYIDPHNPLGYFLNLMRKNRNKLSREELKRESQTAIITGFENVKKYLDEINHGIIQQLKSTRVLCVTENHTNVVMWSHYADSHRGVVFKLNCINEIDNNLLVARKIDYTDKLPIIASLDDFIKNLTGQKALDLSTSMLNLPYTKSLDWSYEKEWRLSILEYDSKGDLYNEYQENPLVFGAIYLGCNMLQENEKKIIKLLNGQFNHVEVFKAHKSNINFELEFERIK